MPLLDLVRLLLGASLLSLAAVRDWRTRRVPDAPWILLAAAGLLLLGWELGSATAASAAYLVLLPSGLLLLDVFWDRGEGFFARVSSFVLYGAAALGVVAVVAVYPGFAGPVQDRVVGGLGVLTVVVLGYLFYYLGLLKGGADAKAFMAVGMLVPGYPVLDPFPLLRLEPVLLAPFNLLFPFALATVLTTTLLLLALPVAFLARNLRAGDLRWPQALLGYRLPVGALSPFVWLLEEPAGAGVRYRVVPRREPDEVDLEVFRDLGRDRVWVTPQIPFLVPFAVGFVLTFLVGNPLLALL